MLVVDVSDRKLSRRPADVAYIDLTRHRQVQLAETRSVVAILHLVVLIGIAVLIAFDFMIPALVVTSAFAGERAVAARYEHKYSRHLRRDLA